MSNNNETFEYTYSAREQKELELIKSKYISKEETPLEQIKRLDKEVEKPGTIASIAIGVIGTLILGAGMSMCLEATAILLIPGIIIGLAGIALIAIAYPVYKKIVKKERERITPQILALMEEVEKK